MNEYSTESVVRTRFPSWHQAADGTWSRTWHLVMEKAFAEKLGHEFDLSGEYDIALLRVDSENSASLITSTREDPMSDELFYFAAYRLLIAIDERIGKIATIEGLPRDAYQPFRPAASRR